MSPEPGLNKPQRQSVHSNELALVRRAAAGEGEARRELFERHRDAAYQVAFRVTGRHEDALDVVQDAFIKAFERLGEFQADSAFRTWLLRIVTNRGLDLLRARKVRLAVSLDAGRDDENEERLDPISREGDRSAGVDLEQTELSERLNRAIETLPPEQRAVFALFALGELTYAEISETVGAPIGTVMSRLFHARRKLHEALRDLAPQRPT
jgi:RNA polymerase sigma-70 factor (ECF subfamily)